MVNPIISIEEKLIFLSKQSISDNTELGGYITYNFNDKVKNIIKFHAPNKVTNFNLIKGQSYLIKYTKIPITKNQYRGLRPLSIK